MKIKPNKLLLFFGIILFIFIIILLNYKPSFDHQKSRNNPYKINATSEKEAIKYLKKNIRERKLSDYWLGDCVVYEADDRHSEWIVEIHEIHNEECGGSPGNTPLLASFKINKVSNEILRYDIVKDQYILLK